MYDTKLVIAGLVVTFTVVSLPTWLAIHNTKALAAPDLEKATGADKCIESTAYMRANHMNLLHQWEKTVVRNGVRTYTASDGQSYNISLSATCFKCHESKQKFCDNCHNYASVKPACWECHNPPEEKKP